MNIHLKQIDELTLDKVKLLHSYGVNRISMGVQTFKPELLKILGRTHKTQDIYNAVEYAKKQILNRLV